MPSYTPDQPASLQARLNADPRYLALKAKFTQTHAPLDHAALSSYAGNLLNAGGMAQQSGGRYAIQIDGSGNVNVQDQNNPWTSPATWGPIAVAAAGAPFMLGVGGGGAGGAAAGGVEAGATSGVEAGLPGAMASLPAVGAGASTGVGAGTGFLAASNGLLPSTTIGTGEMAPLAGSTSSMAGGSGMGFLDTVKQAYDAYSKGKDVYDTGNSVYNQLSGGPVGAIGQTAGNVEQQRMNALIAEARLQQEQDANQIAKNKAVLAAPGSMAQNAARGDVLANAQDATVSGLPSYIHVPTMSGGLRPSLFSAATRNLGSQMSTQANAQMAGGKFTDPTLTPLPQASAFDNVLSGTALAGGFLNAASGLLPKGGSAPDTSGSPSGNDPYSQNYQPVGPVDPNSAAPQDTTNLTGGLDPSILAYWQQQANGATA